MIDTRYLNYIPEEQHEYHYKILLKDVYYFYHGVKIEDNIQIITLNGNKYDLSKKNLNLKLFS